MSNYLPLVKGISRKQFIEKVFRQSGLCYTITKVIAGSLPASEAINAIIRQENIPCGELDEEVSSLILSHTVRAMFHDTSPDLAPYLRNREGKNAFTIVSSAIQDL